MLTSSGGGDGFGGDGGGEGEGRGAQSAADHEAGCAASPWMEAAAASARQALLIAQLNAEKDGSLGAKSVQLVEAQESLKKEALASISEVEEGLPAAAAAREQAEAEKKISTQRE